MLYILYCDVSILIVYIFVRYAHVVFFCCLTKRNKRICMTASYRKRKTNLFDCFHNSIILLGIALCIDLIKTCFSHYTYVYGRKTSNFVCISYATSLIAQYAIKNFVLCWNDAIYILNWVYFNKSRKSRSQILWHCASDWTFFCDDFENLKVSAFPL